MSLFVGLYNKFTYNVPGDGGVIYWVNVSDEKHYICKREGRICSIHTDGKKPCEHVRAVKLYLAAQGKIK